MKSKSCLCFLCLVFVVLLSESNSYSQQLSGISIKTQIRTSPPIAGNTVDEMLMTFTMTDKIRSSILAAYPKNVKSFKIPGNGTYCEVKIRVQSWTQNRIIYKYYINNKKIKLTRQITQNQAGTTIALFPKWAWPLVEPDSRDTNGKILWTSGWLSGTP